MSVCFMIVCFLGKYSLQNLIPTSDYCTIYLKLVFVVLKNINKIFRPVKIAFCKECLPCFKGSVYRVWPKI